MSTEMLDVATILFEVTLFTIFCYYFWIVIQQYVTPVLVEQIKTEKKNLMHLCKQKKLLQTQHENLNKRMESQDFNLCNLDQKMKIWHRQMVAKKKIKKEEAKTLEQALRSKKVLQAQRFAQEKLSAIVIPSAVKKAREDIIETLSENEKVALLSNVIDAI